VDVDARLWAPRGPHADARRVVILRGVSARQCKDFLPTVDSANRPWPTWRRFAAGFFPVGQRAARSLPERWPADLPRGIRIPVQGHQLAHRGGAACSLPLPNREGAPRST
jgi:hypothetical protein